MIDHRMLESGTVDYGELKDSYVIIIAPFDLFGKGCFRYDFSMMCENCDGLKLEDGAKRIFLNTHGVKEDGTSHELIELLRYIENSDPATAERCSSKRVKQIHRKVNAIKHNEEVGIRFMNAWEEKILDEQKARHDEKVQIAKVLKERGVPTEDILESTGLTIEEIAKL